MPGLTCTQLLPGLWRFEDICQVYLFKDGNHALAVDFGSGRWLDDLPALGVEHLDHVVLTHPHSEQCLGLLERADWPFTIHAPVGAERYLAPERAADWHLAPWFDVGCPENYDAPPGRIAGIRYDVSGDGHWFWQGRRVRFMHTPGHTANACTVILDHGGKQVVCCGDAAHAGATLWQPFHLETDHWTGTGALAAWEGVRRLCGINIGLLCPSHGPVIERGAKPMLRKLADRLLRFYHAKGQISPSEKDAYLKPQRFCACGALQYSPHLFQFGANSYLLTSDSGEALVVDPFLPDIPALEALLAELGGLQPTALLVSHYHYDHSDGIPYLREKYGTRAVLHPLIAAPLADPAGAKLPWLHSEPLTADELWPMGEGTWQWQEYRFNVAPWPGQTWWHTVWMATVDGAKVLFGGDSFTPTSKWNGTGGFCAYNGSRFREGFIPSCALALRWAPDIIAAGHQNTYRFSAGKFRKIAKWALQAEQAVRDLCPTGDLEQDYYALQQVIGKYAEGDET